jgi:mycothiol synthase
VPTPDLPPGLTARPIEPGDLPAIADLLAAAEQVDDTGEHEDADDLAGWWVNDLVDLGRDSLVVLDPGGVPVAHATVIAPPTFRGAMDVYVEGRVRPDRRGQGIGRALLGWQLDRAAAVHAERHPEVPARLTTGLPTTMTDAAALARRAGMAEQRWFHTMTRSLADPPGPRAAAGVRLVAFDRDRDEEVRQAHNASFTDHYGSSERDEASWQLMFTGQRGFRPDLSVLAVEDDAVVGYVLAYVHEAATAATGERAVYYGQIGVLPHARGRGLAKAVIADALRRAAENDCQVAELTVDSENSSGALGLYEGLGFVVQRTTVTWVRELPALR